MQGDVRYTYTYDDNGNLTVEQRYNLASENSQVTSYAYDQENRLLVVATDPDSGSQTLASYTYDGEGLRRSEHEPGASLTTLLWDGSDPLMEKS